MTYRNIARDFIKEKIVCPFEIWKGIGAEKKNPNHFSILNAYVQGALEFSSIAVLDRLDDLDALFEKIDQKYDFRGATKENVKITPYKKWYIVTYFNEEEYINDWKMCLGTEDITPFLECAKKYRKA